MFIHVPKKHSKHTVKNLKICKNIEGESPMDMSPRENSDGHDPI